MGERLMNRVMVARELVTVARLLTSQSYLLDLTDAMKGLQGGNWRLQKAHYIPGIKQLRVPYSEKDVRLITAVLTQRAGKINVRVTGPIGTLYEEQIPVTGDVGHDAKNALKAMNRAYVPILDMIASFKREWMQE